MRDEQHGEVGVVPQLHQFVLHATARQRIKRGEGLVHQQNGRFHGHPAGNRYALLHAAGQRVGVVVGKLREVDFVDVVQRTFARLFAAHQATGGQRKHDVLDDGLPGQELVKLLKHHHAIRPRARDFDTAEPDASFDGRDIAANRLEQRRFAAAGRPEQHETIAVVDLEVDAVCRRHQVFGSLVLQRHAINLKQRRGQDLLLRHPVSP